MDYTILSTSTYGNEQILSLNKSGNKYYLGLSSNGTHRCTEHVDLDKAITIYNFIITLMVKGEYSFEDRIRFMQNMAK